MSKRFVKNPAKDTRVVVVIKCDIKGELYFKNICEEELIQLTNPEVTLVVTI